MTRREMYQSGTVCRSPVDLHVDGKLYRWDEPCKYLFTRGPYPTVQGGEIGEAGPVRHEFWYETMADPMNHERFYTTEPLETWY